MNYRQATIEDWPFVKKYGRQFFDLSGWKRVLGEDADCTHGLDQLIGAPNVFFMVAEDGDKIVGGIGVVVAPSQTVQTKLLAQELFWYVDEDYRHTRVAIQLYRSAERWAKEVGAVAITMALLEGSMPDAVAEMYVRMGYEQVERIFVKGL